MRCDIKLIEQCEYYKFGGCILSDSERADCCPLNQLSAKKRK